MGIAALASDIWKELEFASLVEKTFTVKPFYDFYQHENSCTKMERDLTAVSTRPSCSIRNESMNTSVTAKIIGLLPLPEVNRKGCPQAGKELFLSVDDLPSFSMYPRDEANNLTRTSLVERRWFVI